MPAVNPDRPLAPIFVSHSAPVPPLDPEIGSSEATLPNVPAEPEITFQQETFVRPLPDPLQLLSDLPLEEETDEVTEPGTGCNGIDGDAAEASSVFANDSDDSEEPLTKFPSLVMEAFHKQIEFLKQVTEGQGRASKHLIYDKLKSFWLPQTSSFFNLRQSFLSPDILLIPRFFYWDPLLLVDHIPCPLSSKSGDTIIPCSGKLVRHGYCVAPRQIIDLEDSFYLIHVRYRCNECRPIHTFSSSNPLVLEKLPKALSAEFPAHLSKRSGLSKKAFAIMRCCFQNGMGGKQFSDSLNVLHCRQHEKMEVQYLWTILECGNGQYEPFPSFEAGPTAAPSGQYCRDIYDREMEAHEKEFDQHTAQLSSRGMAIDHSHKVNLFIFL